MIPGSQDAMVDFLDVALQRGLVHIVKQICDHLPDESIIDMMCVCRAWKDILSLCGVADRLRATGRFKKWKKALKNPRREVKQILLPQVDHAMVSNVTIVHDLVFCQFYFSQEDFLVYKLDEGSLYGPMHFTTGYIEKVSHFCASVDFHRGSEESALFGIHWPEGGCLLGNYETGTISTIFFPGTCGRFIFNRDYVMAAVERYEIELLRLYKLTWSADGQVQRKLLVHEIKLGPSAMYYTIGPYTEIEALGRLMVFIFEDCTATAWTFDNGQIAEFQGSELKLLDPAPTFSVDILEGMLGRLGNYLVSVLWPGHTVHTTMCNVFIGQICFDTKEIIPVKRLKHDSPKCCISEVTSFGSFGLLVDWVKGHERRSLMSLEEILQCEDLESLLLTTAVSNKSHEVDLLNPSKEVIQIGGCKTCISMDFGQLYTL